MSVIDALRAPVAGSADVACAHCGLPVPSGFQRQEDTEQFCCAGCHTAWSVIHEGGLEGYYRLRERRPLAVRPSRRGFEEFDHPAFEKLYVQRRRDGLLETDLYLEGVQCASCVWLVERVPRIVPGMARAELDVSRARVRLTWDGGQTPLSAAARALDTLGYRPRPYRGQRLEQLRRAEDRAALVRIGVAGAIAGNVMTLALALYAGLFGHMEADVERYFRWVSLALTTPALVWPGGVFFRSAWAALRSRTLHMDVPIAIALGAGFARGAVNTVTGQGPIYFDGVATLIFLLLVGRFLQQRAQRAAADSAELSYALSPATARVLDARGAVSEVPLEAVLPGTLVEVRAGETVPADGVVEVGHATLDVAWLTGESRPVTANPSDRVFAGTLCRDATLHVRVEQTGEQSRLGRILRDVEAGARRRAPIVQSADRMAGMFVGAVLLLAVATWWVWRRLDPTVALDHAIALLIVTCPCALALATPLAITVAVGRAARAGILIRGGAALEALARPGLLILDKTGTITEGRMALIEWRGSGEAKPLVLALERHASHPIAIGFANAWPHLHVPAARDVLVTAGGGIEGTVGGRRVVVGSPRFVSERCDGAKPEPLLDGSASQDALTPIAVAVDGAVVARARFGDPVHGDAGAALASLRARGFRVRLLSGDDPAVVDDVARRVGIDPDDARGGASPEDKLRAIEKAAEHGSVVMVGDGVNDAPAMARATVGVGVRGGAEACLAAADVFLAQPGIGPLVALTDGARRTLGVIRRNIAFSLAYNVAGATLAMTGVITPWMAALLMPASSLTVVLASWLSRTFETPVRATAVAAAARASAAGARAETVTA